jgi:hypothetical protein
MEKRETMDELETDCMASSVIGSVGTPKVAHLWSPTPDYGRYRDKI